MADIEEIRKLSNDCATLFESLRTQGIVSQSSHSAFSQCKASLEEVLLQSMGDGQSTFLARAPECDARIEVILRYLRILQKTLAPSTNYKDEKSVYFIHERQHSKVLPPNECLDLVDSPIRGLNRVLRMTLQSIPSVPASFNKRQRSIGDTTDIQDTFEADPAREHKRRRIALMNQPSFERIDDIRPSGLDGETKQALVKQLHFPQIDERLTTLADAQFKTCTWFLEREDFRSWNEKYGPFNDKGFLWIKGKAGTGKSTLMKYLFENANYTEHVVISFFFLARGVIEERSTNGLFRALLHQIFNRIPAAKQGLDWMTRDGAANIKQNGWTLEALKRSFRESVLTIRSHPVRLYVDALDECPEDEVRDMVEFFEDLCERALEKAIDFRVCFSSRHYPDVQIKNALELSLEEQHGHQDDIRKYIASKLPPRKDANNDRLRRHNELLEEIYDRSSNIFLWVVLVIGIFKKEFGKREVSVTKMRNRLQQIPPDIAELFKEILERHDDNFEELQLCLVWILYAKRPLSPEELYFAMQFELSETCTGAWDLEDVDLESIERYIINVSKGLAEIVNGNRRQERRVQLIHESVREFLLAGHNLPSQLSFSKERDQYVLAECCGAQLAEIMKHKNKLESMSRLSTESDSSRSNSINEGPNDRFPFVKYAAQHVFAHVNDAPNEHSGLMASFTDKAWLENWVEISRESSYRGASILYILARQMLENLIRAQCWQQNLWDVEDETWLEYPILKVIKSWRYEHSSQNIVSALLANQSKLSKQSLPYDVSGSYEITDRLRQCYRTIDMSSKDRARPLLSRAALASDMMLLRILLNYGCNVDDTDERGYTALDTLCCLPKKNWRGTDLELAEMVQLLIDAGADIDAKSTRRHVSPLQQAQRFGHTESANLLLAAGAKDYIGSHYYDGYTLVKACEEGALGVVQYLLGAGTDPNEVLISHRILSSVKDDDNNSSPISESDDENSSRSLSVSDDGDGDAMRNTPLVAAIRNDHQDIVKLLIEAGADVNMAIYGITPLIEACIKVNEATVKLLIEAGADLNMANDETTPLIEACCRTSEGCVKLLIEAGADVHLKMPFNSPLIAACAGYLPEQTVKLLLKAGVDVNSRIPYNQYPAGLAGPQGIKAMLEDREERGDLKHNLVDNEECSALRIAYICDHKRVIKILTEAGATKYW